MRAAGDSAFYTLQIVNYHGNPVGPKTMLPSVTTILKALPKFGLDWWGHKLGVRGAIELMRSELDAELITKITDHELPLDDATELLYEAIKSKTDHRPDRVLESAGDDRGTPVHDVAEKMLRTGKPPDYDKIPVDLHGYVNALVTWHEEKIAPFDHQVLAVETTIYSLEHECAGTLDLLIKLKLGDDWLFIVLDFKTSKKVYSNHLLQSTAYVSLCRERGLIPFDAPTLATVIRLGANGKAEQKNSPFTMEDFLSVKRVWEWQEAQKKGGRYAGAT